VLKDTQIVDGHVPDDIDPSGDTFHTLNGQVNPRIDIKPGELQLWRIGNIGADQYYHLELEGHVFYEIARDGNRHTHIVESTQLLLPPSSRSEVLVRGGPAGSSAFRSLDFETGPAGDSYPGVTLATLVSSGDPVDPIPLPAASAFPPVEDLRTVPNPNPRTIVFSETSDGNTFFINGKTFDENRVDTTVQFGTVEEWTLVNCSQELHVFHIHQLDFQVTEIDGQAVPFTGYQDLVTLPPAPDDDTPSVVKVIIPFDDPVIAGEFVYHCHIIQHEDQGMMATIFVQQPGGPPPSKPLCQ
jgi:FtsP/CotA-like multicopper oxidase with cupredoxin domain